MLPALSEALRRRDFPTAVSLARESVAEKPADAGAHHALGMALHGQGDIDGARAAFERAIELIPDRAVYQMSLAHLDISQQRLQEAEATIQGALQADPNHIDAYVALVQLALARGENEEAARYLKFAQRVDEHHPDVLVAEAHVAQFAGRAEHAIRCLTDAVNADPKHALGQASLGFAYLKQGNHAFAEQALRNARELQPNNYGVLRGLVEAQRLQDKVPDTLETLDDLLLRHPQQHAMRALRADARLAVGNVEGALEDHRQLLEINPAHPQVLLALTRLLQSKGDGAQAVAYAENALSAQPRADINWNTRLGLTSNDHEQTAEVLRRWREALPESGPALEASAQFSEQIGDLDTAETLADQVLSKNENAPICQFIKLRAELRRDPSLALKRLEKLAPAAKAPEAERMVHSWKGFAHHLQGDFAAAGTDFRAMLQRLLPQHDLPKLFDAEGAPSGEGSGTILWAPCGLRIEPVLQALMPVLGPRLMAERNTQFARQDGFGHWRMPPGETAPNGMVAGDAQRWRAALEAYGADPSIVVDWQPHWDAYTAAALKGAHLLVLMMDPRDAFLNWAVFGSAQAYVMYPLTDINARWLNEVYAAVADSIERDPARTTVCVVDNLAEDATVVAKQLQAALDLEQAPNVEVLAAPVRGLGGFEMRFPAGTWRNYRETFRAEFDLLTPIAQRLGYQAD